MTGAATRLVLSAVLVCLAAAVTSAQQPSTTTDTKSFEVIAVDGNRLVVRLPEGTRELTVPADFRFNVDGQMVSVSELKPGMRGTATITTRTTLVPVTVTEVKNGTVLQASGGSILVRTDEGIKSFTQGDVDKRGVKIMRNGQPALISDFRANDRLSATIITSKPPRVLTEKEVQATLARAEPAPATAAPAGPPAQAGAPAKPAPAAGQADPSAGARPKKLPKTASPLPLLGLMGLVSVATGLGLTIRRRRAAR